MTVVHNTEKVAARYSFKQMGYSTKRYYYFGFESDYIRKTIARAAPLIRFINTINTGRNYNSGNSENEN